MILYEKCLFSPGKTPRALTTQEAFHSAQRQSLKTSQQNLRFTYDLTCSVTALKTPETMCCQRWDGKKCVAGKLQDVLQRGLNRLPH